MKRVWLVIALTILCAGNALASPHNHTALGIQARFQIGQQTAGQVATVVDVENGLNGFELFATFGAFQNVYFQFGFITSYARFFKEYKIGKLLFKPGLILEIEYNGTKIGRSWQMQNIGGTAGLILRFFTELVDEKLFLHQTIVVGWTPAWSETSFGRFTGQLASFAGRSLTKLTYNMHEFSEHKFFSLQFELIINANVSSQGFSILPFQFNSSLVFII